MHDDLDFEKVNIYVIEPYLTSRRATNFEIVKIPASVEHIKIKNNTFQLNKWQVKHCYLEVLQTEKFWLFSP